MRAMAHDRVSPNSSTTRDGRSSGASRLLPLCRGKHFGPRRCEVTDDPHGE